MTNEGDPAIRAELSDSSQADAFHELLNSLEVTGLKIESRRDRSSRGPTFFLSDALETEEFSGRLMEKITSSLKKTVASEITGADEPEAGGIISNIPNRSGVGR